MSDLRPQAIRYSQDLSTYELLDSDGQVICAISTKPTVKYLTAFMQSTSAAEAADLWAEYEKDLLVEIAAAIR